MRIRPAVAAVALLATVTACGSTVQQSSRVANGQPAGDGLTTAELGGAPLDTSASASGSGAATGAPGVTAGVDQATSSGSAVVDGTAGTGPTRAPGSPTTPSGTSVGSRSGPSGTAPGVTATTIKVGVYTVQGFSKFASSLGASISTGDNEAQAKAVINYLNARGGIAGRKIVPVFHDFDVSSAQTDINTEYQRACADWTEDDRVYAVITPIGTTNANLYECLSQAGVPAISTGDSKDASFFQKYGSWFYQPVDMNQRRIMSNNVDALVAGGFFGKDAKVGVVLTNTPDEKAAVAQGLKPALARHGLKLDEVFEAPLDNNAPAAYGNAVLRFKAQGITNVLFSSAGSPIAFAQYAESQNYFPRYGLQSKNSPSTLQGVMSKASQRGAMGLGWQPMNDVDAARDPGAISSRQTLCLKLMKEAGEDTSVRATAVFGLWYCDMLFFLRDSLLRAPSFDVVAGFRPGAESLTSFESASTYRSSFAPNRLHDGASAYRLFAFKENCGCYEYVSPVRPAS